MGAKKHDSLKKYVMMQPFRQTYRFLNRDCDLNLYMHPN
jgi:hypothetical protein